MKTKSILQQKLIPMSKSIHQTEKRYSKRLRLKDEIEFNSKTNIMILKVSNNDPLTTFALLKAKRAIKSSNSDCQPSNSKTDLHESTSSTISTLTNLKAQSGTAKFTKSIAPAVHSHRSSLPSLTVSTNPTKVVETPAQKNQGSFKDGLTFEATPVLTDITHMFMNNDNDSYSIPIRREPMKSRNIQVGGEFIEKTLAIKKGSKDDVENKICSSIHTTTERHAVIKSIDFNLDKENNAYKSELTEKMRRRRMARL